jgi:NhaP-type Na+/H+ or K+/H+ antiporter
VPDVLVLVLVGIAVGPLLGSVQPEDFGKLGSVIATIALVVILFESGTSLDLATLGRTAGTTGLLTLMCFVLSAAAVVSVAIMAFDLACTPALLLGATLGGTASAVVIPMVGSLKVSPKPATVLVMESVLTDARTGCGPQQWPTSCKGWRNFCHSCWPKELAALGSNGPPMLLRSGR